MASRKWNGLGRTQIAILKMVSRVPKTAEQIENRIAAREMGRTIESLVSNGLLYLRSGKYHPTDHGKAIIMMPEQYQKWRQMWGLA